MYDLSDPTSYALYAMACSGRIFDHMYDIWLLLRLQPYGTHSRPSCLFQVRIKGAPVTEQVGNTSCAHTWCRQTDELRGELLQKERRLENAIARDINRGLQAVKQVTRRHNIQ